MRIYIIIAPPAKPCKKQCLIGRAVKSKAGLLKVQLFDYLKSMLCAVLP